MSDLLREIQEDIARDKWAALWQRYGRTVIGMAVAIVLGVAANQGWQAYRHAKLEGYTTALLDAVRKPNAAGFGKVAEDTGGVHSGIASLIQAQLLMADGKQAEAEKILQNLAANGEDVPAELARALTHQGATESLRSTAFYATALERSGWAAIEAGEMETAEKAFIALQQFDTAPESIKDRARSARAYIQSRKSAQ